MAIIRRIWVSWPERSPTVIALHSGKSRWRRLRTASTYQRNDEPAKGRASHPLERAPFRAEHRLTLCADSRGPKHRGDAVVSRSRIDRRRSGNAGFGGRRNRAAPLFRLAILGAVSQVWRHLVFRRTHDS